MITKEEKQIELEQKAAELSKSLNCKVHPLLFMTEDGEGFVTGFVKEPNRVTKQRYLDKAIQQPAIASGELLEACLIREESDPKIMDEDIYYFGASANMASIVQAAVNLYDKKK